jgi:hypothetical protein
MPRKPGSAQFTEHLAVACKPEQKEALIAAAAVRGVTYSVVARWALEEWLARNPLAGSTTTAAPAA